MCSHQTQTEEPLEAFNCLLVTKKDPFHPMCTCFSARKLASESLNLACWPSSQSDDLKQHRERSEQAKKRVIWARYEQFWRHFEAGRGPLRKSKVQP